MNQSQKRKDSKAPEAKAQGNKFTASVIKISNLRDLPGAIKIDTSLLNTLSMLGGELVMRIGPKGFTMEIENSKKDTICDVSEVQKVNSFARFLAEDEKVQTSQEVIEPILMSLYILRLNKPEAERQLQLTPAQIVVAKEYSKRLDILGSNIDFLRESLEGDYKKHLLAYLSLCILAVGDVMGMIADNRYQKEEVDILLFDRGIPKWVFQKLTSNLLSSQGPYDPRAFFFPKDGLKGIEFTFRELVSGPTKAGVVQPFVEMGRNPFILAQADHLVSALRNEAFVKRFLAPNLDLKVPDSPESRLLLDQPFLIPQPWTTFEAFIDHKANMKTSKQERIPPSGDSIQINCKRVSHAIQITGLLESDKFYSPYEDMWGRIFTSAELANRGPNPFATVKAIPDAADKLEEYVRLRNKKAQDAYVAIFKHEIASLAPSRDVHEAFFAEGPNLKLEAIRNAAEVKDSTGKTPHDHLVEEGKIKNDTLKGRFLSGTDLEHARKATVKMRPLGSQKKVRTAAAQNALTTKMSKGLDALKSYLPPATIKSLGDWLRTFVNDKVREVAYQRLLADLESKGTRIMDAVDSESDDEEDTD